MTRTFPLLVAFVLAVGTGPVSAACYADYKAKRDNPLRLHYGVAEVNACDRQGAASELRRRLRDAGWELLDLVSVFEADRLEEKRESAGDYFLRY
jgi:hypothetical protein